MSETFSARIVFGSHVITFQPKFCMYSFFGQLNYRFSHLETTFRAFCRKRETVGIQEVFRVFLACYSLLIQ